MPSAKEKANEENYSEDDDPRRFFLEKKNCNV
jgi:hypothetical protein